MFLDNLKTLYRGKKNRKGSWDKFLDKGLPSKSWESYQYVPLDTLYEQNFTLPTSLQYHQKHALEGIRNVLVFINGVFNKELSSLENLPPSLLVLPLSEAEVKFGAFLEGKVDESDPFSLLNHAFYEEGLFLYFPKGLKLDDPIQIVNIYTEKALYSPRTHLFLSKESQCTLYVTEHSLSDEGWINSGIDIHMEERASLHLYTLFEKQPRMFHTESMRVEQKKESYLKIISSGFGKKLWRQNFHVALHKQAESHLLGAFAMDEKNEAHIHTHVQHKDEASHSFQKFKGVLNGQSRLSFEGKIFVESTALKTEAYQLNNNLLLSEKARVYSKPNLEIFADDVKASHGATAGKLNAEDVFYLTSKGLPRPIAKQLLIDGFYKEIVDQIPLKQAAYAKAI